ncbi:hypothetical protein BH09SUM1_BH09SUM1_31580 [soil metagenome]
MLGQRDWKAVFAVAAASCLVKILSSPIRGFWLDEYYTMQSASLPFQQMVAERINAGHSPLPFLYARFFLITLGSSETAARASAALAVAFAIIGSAALLSRLRLREHLAPFLAIAFFHPYWQAIGTEFRYTMPLVAICAFWAWAYTAWLRRERPKQWIASVVLGALALWTHASAQFLLIAFLLSATAWVATRQHLEGAMGRWIKALSPLLASLLLSVPLLYALSGGNGPQGRTENPDLAAMVNNQMKTFFADDAIFQAATGVRDDVFMGLFVLVSAVAVVLAARFALRRGRTLTLCLLFGSLVALPFCAMAFSFIVKNIQGPHRYVAFTSVPLLIVFAIAWTESARIHILGRIAYRSVFSILTASAFFLQVFNQGDWHREACIWLAHNRRAQEPIITMGRTMNLYALKVHGLPFDGFVDGVSSEDLDPKALTEMIRDAAKDADLAYLLVYHGARMDVGDALGGMQSAGFLRTIWEQEPTAEVQLFVLTRNAAGDVRARELPALRRPRFTESPTTGPRERLSVIEPPPPSSPAPSGY